MPSALQAAAARSGRGRAGPDAEAAAGDPRAEGGIPPEGGPRAGGDLRAEGDARAEYRRRPEGAQRTGVRRNTQQHEQPEKRAAVHLLPHFDCYVVGGFPRNQLIPETAPEQLRKGTAAPFSVLLVDGVVAGLWERRARGKRLEVRVHAFAGLSRAQQREVERQAARIGEILELRAEVSFGHVEPRGHL